MNIKLNNKSIVRRLSLRGLKTNGQRNIILSISIIIITFVIASIFIMGLSYLSSIKQQQLFSEGMSYDAGLTSPTEQQIEKIKKNSSIKHAGMQISCASVIKYKDERVKYTLKWKDDTNWKKQTLPAIENVAGEYPTKENEIMMSEWSLKNSGINQYYVGMEIPLTYIDKYSVKEKVFVLSGYFKDYTELMDPTTGSAYVSKTFMDTTGNNSSDIKSSKLLITYNNIFLSNKKISNIENTLELNNKYQIFFHEENGLSTTITIFIGMGLLSMLIVICGYLAIYNIMYISITKDIRYYGLLKSVGTTRNQIKKIIVYQVLFLTSVSIPIGLLLGTIFAKQIIPSILLSANSELIATNVSFHYVIYICSAILSFMATYISSISSSKIALKISPIEASKYIGFQAKPKRKKTTSGGKVYRMAWSNVFREKKKAYLVIISLFLSSTIFLTVNVIIQGRNPDSFIRAHFDSEFMFYNQTFGGEEPPEQVFDSEMLSQIDQITNITSVNKVSSNPIFVKYDKELFSAYLKSYYERYMRMSYEDGIQQIEEDPNQFYGFIIGISDKDFEDINSALPNKIDKSEFKNGNIAIMNGNGLSSELKIEGQSIQFRNENGQENKITIARVTDDLSLSDIAGIAPSIYVYEGCLNKYNVTPLYERINIDFKQKLDKTTSNQLKGFVADNSKINVLSTVDVKASMESVNNRLSIIGNFMAGIIGIIGLLNLVNVMVNSVMSRQREFGLLMSIGMTKRQVRRMIMIESQIYGGITLILAYSLGLIISYLVFDMLKTESYIKFSFPFSSLLVEGVIILIATSIIPLLVYNWISKKNLIQITTLE